MILSGEPLIYAAYCRVTKKSYVGQTTNFFGVVKNGGYVAGRRQRHLREAARGSRAYPKFYPALRKYGESSFDWYVLQRCDGATQKELNDLEIFWISKIDSMRGGYNCDPGGLGGVHSQETLRKISESKLGQRHTPETRAKMSATRLRMGRHCSLETKAKISASLRGKTASPEARAKQSAVRKGRRLKPETVAKIAAKNTGKKRSPELKARLSAMAKGRHYSPEAIANMAAGQRRRWAAMREVPPLQVPLGLGIL